LRSKFDRSRRTYVKLVPRECAQSSVWGVCETKLQLLELLSHNGDEDATIGKGLEEQMLLETLFVQIG
jgi:hypothetical protein